MSKEKSRKTKMGIKLTAEEAKRLSQQPNARKLNRMPNQQDGGVDMVAVGWSLLAFLGFLGAVILYITLTGADQIIPPMKAGMATIIRTDASEPFEQDLARIENLWNSDQLDQAVAQINVIYEEVDEASPRTGKSLAMLKLKSFVVQKQYEVGNRYALTLMQRYRGDDLVLADIFWYRGHIYYYQRDYIEAMNSFGQVVDKTGTYAVKAQEYREEIREVINDDAAWF
jgi:hypothetical protein